MVFQVSSSDSEAAIQMKEQLAKLQEEVKELADVNCELQHGLNVSNYPGFVEISS